MSASRSSSCSSTAPRSEDCPNRSCRSLAIVNFICSISSARARASASRLRAFACASRHAACAAITIAFRVSTSGASDQSVTQSPVQNLGPLDWATAPGISQGAGNYPIGPVDPTGSGGIQLAQNRPRISPEDEFDPLAPVRTDIYNAARNDLQRLQPGNYALSVRSLRRPGSAPTINEIGELKYAYGVAQSTQPLADTASRISGLVDSFGQKFRTVAVLQTTKGTFIAGSGNVELEPAQLNAVVSAGATQVEAAGVDAEITALKYAKDNGRGDPQYIAASRPFCPDCRREIQGRGGLITSPTTAVFPRNIPWVAFSGR